MHKRKISVRNLIFRIIFYLVILFLPLEALKHLQSAPRSVATLTGSFLIALTTIVIGYIIITEGWQEKGD